VKAEATAGIRLYCSDQWQPKSEGSGHTQTTHTLKKAPILQMGTERIIPRHIFEKPFTVKFSDKSEREDGFQTNRKGGLTWYTDGSKTNNGTGAEVYGYSIR
jgi:hypothetical protein